ncbi:MAG TPA: DUF5916 domain-containing protein [Balneolales bacterium]|nr:DUF5916 domain-containing protein [Balneolales bacterium]
MKAIVLTMLVFLGCVCPLLAQSYNKINSFKAFRTKSAINVDGLLNEKVWKKAPVITNFKQREPVEGASPTEKTVVKVLYTKDAIYVGAKMYDNAPDSIIAKIGRRDASLTADEFTFYIDPYNDNQTGLYFGVNAGGTRYDGTLFNDSWDDDSWDGVWQGKAHIDSTGWTVEMRIPYSQLRFQKEKSYTWGIDFKRFIARKNEKDYLKYQPRNSSGFVSRFDDLTGISSISPAHDFEIIPYVTTKASYLQHEPGDPFNKGSVYDLNTGADIKTNLGSNLTVNATVNPDFGQVEVDPAVVNLSDVETYFPEKRPFFIEGSNFFNFGRGGSNDYWNFNWWGPSFFYSRRIGRAPQGSVPDNANYVKSPDGTHIIGAAKLTGRLNGNWNVGALQAVTASESAKYSVNNRIHSIQVEPLTYYGVARVQKQFNNAKQSIGMIGTLTDRSFNNNALRNDINNSSGVLGIDGWTFLDKDRMWVVTGWMGMSHITGTRERMLNVQTNSTHYLQRPDLKHYGVDSSATSLTGYAGRVWVNKQKGNVIFNAALGLINPKFDLNDVGFLARTNIINSHAGFGYNWTNPTNWYHSQMLIGALFGTFDFNGNNTSAGIWGSYRLQLLNYYSFRLNVAFNPKTMDNQSTRGGPLMISHGGAEYDLTFSSDSRKSIVVSLGAGNYLSRDHSQQWYIQPSVKWKPAVNLSISVNPSYSWSYDKAHYINTFTDPTATQTYDHRYVFAVLDQNTISSSIRVNWTFTPKLSLQMYAQPLISSGKFTNYKALARPKSYDFLVFGKDNGSTFDQQNYTADPDGIGPAKSMDLGNPNFNYKSLRGNAILRWEYRPGSTIYFVWTQTRTDSQEIGRFDLGNSFPRLINAHPNNIFLVKFSYWFNL